MNHTFYIEYNNVKTQIFPQNTGHKIKGTKEGWRYREKLDSKLIVNYNEGYQFIKSLEIENPKLILYVYRIINGVENLRVTGYFYPSDCEYDDDQKFVSIKCEAYDSYTDILLNYENKINLLAIGSIVDADYVNANIISADFEYKTENISFTYLPNELYYGAGTGFYRPLSSQIHTSNHIIFTNFKTSNPNSPNDNGWQIQDIKIYLDTAPSWQLISGSISNYENSNSGTAHAEIKYYRVVKYIYRVNGVSTPSDSNWFLDYDFTGSNIYNSVLDKYGKRPAIFNGYYNDTFEMSTYGGFGYFDFYGGGYYECYSQPSLNIGYQYYYGNSTNKNNYFRPLKPVLDYFLQSIGTGLTVSSQLLFSNTNPLTGNSNDPRYNERNDCYYYKTVNVSPSLYRTICIAALSDIKQVPQSTECAWKQLISLKDLLDAIKIMFNADWSISGDKLIIENCEYFNNGFKYPLQSTLNSSIDLSDQEKNKYKNKYTYDKSNLCHMETISMPYCDSIDFIGVDIVYNASFNADKQIVKTSTINNITSDLSSIYTSVTNPDVNSVSVGNDGFVFAVVDRITENGVTSATIVNCKSPITGRQITNGLMSISMLEENFYKYYRPFKTGILNLKQQQFLSYIPNKKQQEVFYSNSSNSFLQNARYKTELGNNGQVSEYTEELDTAEINLTLMH